MRSKVVSDAFWVIANVIAVFLIGMFLGDIKFALDQARRGPQSYVGASVETSRAVVSLASKHPDPAISGVFADKIVSGEIIIDAEIPDEGVLASIGPVQGIYLLTIDPSLIKPGLTEEVFMVLSHEHQHYRQFVENWIDESTPMTDTQCTMVILCEVDANAKSCRDAIRYGWSSPWKNDFCGRTMAQIAEYTLRRRKSRNPECEEVWNFYAQRTLQ